MSDGDTSGKSSSLRRRGALLGLLAVGMGASWALPRVTQLFAGRLSFEDLEDPPGFRRIAGGETSSLPSPFFGLEMPKEQAQTIPEEVIRADLCTNLFGSPPPTGVVPIASFSDYNCPFCRVLTQRLSDLEARAGGGVRITWHEWPLLGQTSISAARAADMQGAYTSFHQRLMRGRFAATPESPFDKRALRALRFKSAFHTVPKTAASHDRDNDSESARAWSRFFELASAVPNHRSADRPYGEPGSMYAVLAPTALIQSWTGLRADTQCCKESSSDTAGFGRLTGRIKSNMNTNLRQSVTHAQPVLHSRKNQRLNRSVGLDERPGGCRLAAPGLWL